MINHKIRFILKYTSAHNYGFYIVLFGSFGEELQYILSDKNVIFMDLCALKLIQTSIRESQVAGHKNAQQEVMPCNLIGKLDHEDELFVWEVILQFFSKWSK